MGITHVLRGEDLLSSTPRQIALYHALIDIGRDRPSCRASATCPTSWARATRSSRKRDPESNLFHHRDRGFIPEGLVNYLALLGWSLTHDRDVFSHRRDGRRVRRRRREPQPGPLRPEEGRVDQRRPHPAARRRRLRRAHHPVPGRGRRASRSRSPPRSAPCSREAAPLVQERMQLLGETPGMLGFLFTDAASLVVEDDARASLPANAGEVLAASLGALELVPEAEWTHDAHRGGAARRAHRGPRASSRASPSARCASPSRGRRVSPAAVRVDGDPRQGRDARAARPALGDARMA